MVGSNVLGPCTLLKTLAWKLVEEFTREYNVHLLLFAWEFVQAEEPMDLDPFFLHNIPA